MNIHPEHLLAIQRTEAAARERRRQLPQPDRPSGLRRHRRR